jgi:hypothetical protein
MAAERPPILIGSRALRLQPNKRKGENAWMEQLSVPPKDWDFIMTLDQATRWIHSHPDGLVDLEFVLADLKTYKAPHKIICRFKSGTVVEIEISDYFESWSLLPLTRYDPAVEMDAKLGLRVAQTEIPTWDVLLVIKYCHLFLPVHWQKSARQIAEVMRVCKVDCSTPDVPKTAKSWSGAQSLAEFIKKRQTENYRTFRNLRPYTPERRMVPTMTPDRLVLVRKCLEDAAWDLGSPLLTPAGAGEESFQEFCTGLKLSTSRWRSATLPERTKAIIELVGFVLVHLYTLEPSSVVLEHLYANRHSWATNADFAQAIWNLALESLCTTFFALPPRTATHIPASFFASTIGVYNCFANDINPAAQEKPLAHKHIQKLLEAIEGVWIDDTDNREGPWLADFPLEARAHESPLLSIIFFSLPDLLERKNIPECVQKLTDPIYGLAPPQLVTSNLPADSWNEIILQLEDHISVLNLYSTCKSARAVGTSDAVWKNLATRIFGDHFEKPKQGQSWLSAFKFFYLTWRGHCFSYTVACPTCGERHEKMSETQWQNQCEEHQWYWCICPECDASSWSTCAYYERFMKN